METEDLFVGVSIAIEKNLCTGCSDCISVCAPQILKIDKDTKKIKVINSDLCTGCAECINACFSGALELVITQPR